MTRVRLTESMLCARIYPPEFVRRLQLAAVQHDTREINAVMDELAERGYCRPRSSDGKSEAGPEGCA